MDVQPFSVSVTHEDDSVVVCVQGELDLVTSGLLDDALTTALDEGAENIIVDMSAVSYIDSESVRVLLRTQHSLREREGELFVRRCSAVVVRAFTVLGIERYFRFCSSNV